MPNMDGPTATEEIRAMGYTAPIFGLTGKGTVESAVRNYRDCFNAYRMHCDKSKPDEESSHCSLASLPPFGPKFPLPLLFTHVGLSCDIELFISKGANKVILKPLDTASFGAMMDEIWGWCQSLFSPISLPLWNPSHSFPPQLPPFLQSHTSSAFLHPHLLHSLHPILFPPLSTLPIISFSAPTVSSTHFLSLTIFDVSRLKSLVFFETWASTFTGILPLHLTESSQYLSAQWPSRSLYPHITKTSIVSGDLTHFTHIALYITTSAAIWKFSSLTYLHLEYLPALITTTYSTSFIFVWIYFDSVPEFFSVFVW